MGFAGILFGVGKTFSAVLLPDELILSECGMSPSPPGVDCGDFSECWEFFVFRFSAVVIRISRFDTERYLMSPLLAMEERIRFTWGTKVEVLNMKDLPFGSWHCAEIFSGDGRTYMVRYYTSNSTSVKNTLGRVSHEFIRPYQPLLDITRTWLPGEVVEVFDNFSWKMGNVLRASGGNYFLIRLLGLSQVLRACTPNIRARRSWQDGKWTLIGPGSITQKRSSGSRCREVIDLETCNFSVARRRRAHHRQGLRSSSGPMIPKSQGRGSPYYDSKPEELHPKRVVIRPPARPFPGSSNDSISSSSIQSSISSCSIIRSTHFSGPPPPEDVVRDQGTDAESSCPTSFPQEVEAEVHQLELYAYHCTMEALCASGPLSWERESLVTNLRMTLHISNDEHLSKLRQLVRVDHSTRVT
ncbi:hypothetical protein MLD38_014995 [Melastoma candidum]|uniref:Uncharacterized protein n=1 Tax=Melastoma candidum TaxID=119954 RepID=A0ACB9REH2_9MYRT|nr:hypothetical protein MLD38_014995 [Melastoma candidum]